mgnify:CR=1 FL=1
MRVFFRKIHRWLGLLLAAQIAAWMLSGFYFSLVPITEIRGEHLTRPAEVPAKVLVAAAPAPSGTLAAIDDHFGRDWELDSLTLYALDGKLFWRVNGTVDGTSFARLVDFESGAVRGPLSAEQAEARAQYLLSPSGLDPSVQWITEPPPNRELRGRTLPVWRVEFSEPENVRLYLDPWTGELLARRTDRWRIFDFLWMLHIMDYETRDDFNHPLLQTAAFLGLLVTLGGFMLWVLTTRIFRRRKVVQ